MTLVSLSDPATLRRTAPVVRLRGHVRDLTDLEANGLQRTDGGLPTGAGALDEHVDLAHAVLHRPTRGGLGGQLRGERRRLARAFEAHLARGGPGDHRTGRVGDGHDGVVERALDVRLPVGDVLAFLAPDLLDSGRAGACLRRHMCVRSCLRSSPARGRHQRLLLAGLLLAGDRALGTLAGARVGTRALAAHGQATAVADALVAARLHLAPDVRGDLAAQVALDLEVGLDVVTEVDDLLVREVTGPLARVDVGRGQRLQGAGAADAEDVRERDLHPLVAGEVYADETCHVGVLLQVAEVCARPTPAC